MLEIDRYHIDPHYFVSEYFFVLRDFPILLPFVGPYCYFLPVFQRPKLLLLPAFGSGSFGGGAAWMVLEPSPVEETGGQGVCFQGMFVDVCCLE